VDEEREITFNDDAKCFCRLILRRISVNKLAFTLATVAALSLSTVAFAQTSTPASTPKAVQSTQSKTHVTHHVKKRHHAATNKVAASRHDRSLSRHHGSKNKKVVTKHTPAKSVKTKAAS
jgi:hypothetical protein